VPDDYGDNDDTACPSLINGKSRNQEISRILWNPNIHYIANNQESDGHFT
jgi:hypothetical protein